MISMDKSVALVLSGGGARGAYEVGAWQALREMNIQIDLACGTSVGAINSALIAQGSFDTAVTVWKQLENHMVFDIEPTIKNNEESKESHHMDFDLSFDNIPLSELGVYAKNLISNGGTGVGNLKTLLNQHIDETAIRNSPIDFGLVTTELPLLNIQRLFIEDIPQGDLIDFIIASASCFPAAQVYEINDSKYIDGAYKDNLPVTMALEKGFTQVIAIDLDATGVIPKEPLEEVANLIYIRSPWNLGGFLNFDGKNASFIMRLGYLDTLKAFNFYDGNLYTFSKGTMDKSLLSGAESAGKTFSLNPTTLYTEHTFNYLLKSAVECHVDTLKNIQNPPYKNHMSPVQFLNTVSDMLKKNLSRETATLMIAEYMRENPEINLFSGRLNRPLKKEKSFVIPLVEKFVKRIDETFLKSHREAAAYLLSRGII